MLTPYLEKLIQKGDAKFRTFVCGQSGSNLLPISPKSWVVITGFTYINFADPQPLTPPSNFQDYIARSLHQVRFKSSKSNNHYIVKDDIRRDVGAAGSDINQIVNGTFGAGIENWTFGTGWVLIPGAADHAGISGAGNLTNIGFIAIRGRRYRLTYEVPIISGAHPVQPFLGNTAGFVRSTLGVFTEEIVAGNVVNPQLEFRCPAAGPADDIAIDNIELILLPEPDVVIINGHYKFDCYLPHRDQVTVELVGYPTEEGVLQNLAAAPASFPLAAPPAGYGNVGAGGIAQVDLVAHPIGGFDTFNLPLTRLITDPTPFFGVGSNVVQNGMEIPVTDETAINEQVDSFRGDVGPRNFPIVNVQYVEIGGLMPDNIKGST